jgi:hypothetical protein
MILKQIGLRLKKSHSAPLNRTANEFRHSSSSDKEKRAIIVKMLLVHVANWGTSRFFRDMQPQSRRRAVAQTERIVSAER